MLDYTGHFMVDIGLATITAFVKKKHPKKLTSDDLEEMADYMSRNYIKEPLRSFLSIAFTSNAWFIQPAYNPDQKGLTAEEKEKRRKERQMWSERHLYQWKEQIDSNAKEIGVFTGEPVVTKPLSKRLRLGRVGRAQIPLTLGDQNVNFLPYGDAGIPVSGKALLAIQAFPLGCAKSGGRLLAVHSDNEDLIFYFAKTFLQANRKAIQLAQDAGSKKMPEPILSHRTLLIDTLLKADEMQHESLDEDKPFSLTVYRLSNSGQGPDLNIYHLPFEIASFLRVMHQARYRQQWQAIVQRAWERAPKTKRKPKKPFQPSKNWLYEDLFDLPDNAPQFIRTYFLRVALRYARGKTDPRVDYSLENETHLVSWEITSQFLRRILHMDKDRIENIRALGDRLADYVASQNDRRFFRQFYLEQRYGFFRTTLIKANLAHVKRGKPPLITLAPYIDIFEEGDEVARPDWRLARDLVLIRMVERLYENGWLGGNADVLPDETEEISQDDTQS